MGFLVRLIQKNLFLLVYLKYFMSFFFSVFVNFLFVFSFFFFSPAFLFDSGDFPKKCVQLWKGLFLHSLTDFYFLRYACLTLRKLSLILALQFNFRSLIL